MNNRRYKKKNMILADIMLGYTILVLCFFVNILPLMRFIFPSDIEKAILAGSTTIALIIYMIIKKDLFQNKIYEYIILGTVMACFACINSAWPKHILLFFITSILLCILAINEKIILKVLEIALVALMVADLIYAIITIWCFFNGDFYLEHIMPLFPWAIDRLMKQYNSGCIAGLTSHYSTNAMYLSTGLLIAVAMFLKKRQKRYFIIIALMLIALLMTGKRAHIIFSILSIFLLYFFSLAKQGIIQMFVKTIRVAVITFIVAAVLFMLFPSLATFITRFQERIAAGDVSYGRFGFWILAWNAFKENPLFGIGWKHYQLEINPGYDVHNVYLQLICETGVVGTIAFLTWFIILYWRTLKCYIQIISLKRSDFIEKRHLLSFSLMYQSFFFLYCLTGNPLYELIMYVPYFFSCAITIYYTKERKELNKTRDNNREVNVVFDKKVLKWW